MDFDLFWDRLDEIREDLVKVIDKYENKGYTKDNCEEVFIIALMQLIDLDAAYLKIPKERILDSMKMMLDGE